jgi:hypothetical protein
MIVNFKIYEKIDQKPKVGDYVLIKISEIDALNKFPWIRDEIIKTNNFINNNIGKIIYIEENIINVRYTNIPKKIRKYFNYVNLEGSRNRIGWKSFNYRFINEFGETKEELETKLQAKKYNL